MWSIELLHCIIPRSFRIRYDSKFLSNMQKLNDWEPSQKYLKSSCTTWAFDLLHARSFLTSTSILAIYFCYNYSKSKSSTRLSFEGFLGTSWEPVNVFYLDNFRDPRDLLWILWKSFLSPWKFEFSELPYPSPMNSRIFRTFPKPSRWASDLCNIQLPI